MKSHKDQRRLINNGATLIKLFVEAKKGNTRNVCQVVKAVMRAKRKMCELCDRCMQELANTQRTVLLAVFIVGNSRDVDVG